MSHSHDVDYTRYSLTDGNPYMHRNLDVTNDRDQKLVMDFEGFPHVSQIDEHIDSTCAEQRSTAFLVSGRAGAGRATLAGIILDRYQDRCGLTGRFAKTRFNKTDHNNLSRINKIVKEIRNEVVRGNYRYRKQLWQEVPDGNEDLQESDLQGRAECLAHFAREEMEPNTHLILEVQGVQNDGFMDSLANVFEKIPMIIVVTRDHYSTPDTASERGLDERPRWQVWAQHLKLPPLTGQGVTSLATSRWDHAAPVGVPCPFDQQGLTNTFSSRREPAGQALRWLEWLLERRLKRYSGSELWPHARELEIPAEWIEEMVQAVETGPQSH